MAIVRCQDHPPRTTNYTIAVKPTGFPNTALVCGREGANHLEAGWVYLKSDEYERYKDGVRVFELWGPESSSTAAKVQVTDEVVEGLEKWSDESNGESDSGPTLQSQSSIDRF